MRTLSLLHISACAYALEVPLPSFPVTRLHSAADLAAAVSCGDPVVVHFHKHRCRTCLAMRPQFARLAREDAIAPFARRWCDMLIEDDETMAMAMAEGIEHLPAVRVYMGSQACDVRCGASGAGLTRGIREMRLDIERACTGGSGVALDPSSPTSASAEVPANILSVMLPLSMLSVMGERLESILLDLQGSV